MISSTILVSCGFNSIGFEIDSGSPLGNSVLGSLPIPVLFGTRIPPTFTLPDNELLHNPTSTCDTPCIPKSSLKILEICSELYLGSFIIRSNSDNILGPPSIVIIVSSKLFWILFSTPGYNFSNTSVVNLSSRALNDFPCANFSPTYLISSAITLPLFNLKLGFSNCLANPSTSFSPPETNFFKNSPNLGASSPATLDICSFNVFLGDKPIILLILLISSNKTFFVIFSIIIYMILIYLIFVRPINHYL